MLIPETLHVLHHGMRAERSLGTSIMETSSGRSCTHGILICEGAQKMHPDGKGTLHGKVCRGNFQILDEKVREHVHSFLVVDASTSN